MAIDIRATCTCSLGTLISASVSDDYIQGSGLIKTKGNCVIDGTITPEIGSIVTFAYTKGGVTTTLPRKLRVLSSFADPFRRTTTVELGCKLTYLQDKKDQIKWEWYDDDENNDRDPSEAEIVIIPIHASAVMDECLTQLGITASSNPLTNQFSIAEFDYSPGYVQILSDLLVSECYCGYLDTDEVLQIVNLNVEGGTGPVLDSTNIIDIGPIGVGQVPGDAVTVSYSTLKLKDKEEPDLTTSTYSTEPTSILIGYTNPSTGEPANKTYTNWQYGSTETQYTYIRRASDGSTAKVVTSRRSEEWSSKVAVVGSWFSQMLTKGNIAFLNNPIVGAETTETFEYDSEARVVSSLRKKRADPWYQLGLFSIPTVFDDGSYVFINTYGPDYWVLMEETETTYEYTGKDVLVTTKDYGPWAKTIAGQQAMAEAGQAVSSVQQAETLIYQGMAGRHLLDVRYEWSYGTEQEIPKTADQLAAYYADGTPDPANGYQTESKAELELVTGSSDAQLRTEFSMPYAPDDVFVLSGGSYSSVPSDAAEKANNYGRVQNALLYGNRYGMNVQLAPEALPAAPFSPVFVSAAGYVALYRTNATSFTMDANGIVASSDLLFIGGVGTV